MATWIEIEKIGNDIFMDGNKLIEGEEYGMGLGYIILRNTQKVGLHICRFSSGRNFVYSTKLGLDGKYRLGPAFGHRVRPASEEVDPVKKVLRELNIPVSTLSYSTDLEANVHERSIDIERYQGPEYINRWYTNGQKILQEANIRDMSDVNQYCASEISQDLKISKADWAFNVKTTKHMNGGMTTKICQVIVFGESLFDLDKFKAEMEKHI